MSEVSSIDNGNGFIIQTVGDFTFSSRIFSFQFNEIRGMYIDQTTNYLNLLFFVDGCEPSYQELRIPINARTYSTLQRLFENYLKKE